MSRTALVKSVDPSLALVHSENVDQTFLDLFHLTSYIESNDVCEMQRLLLR